MFRGGAGVPKGPSDGYRVIERVVLREDGTVVLVFAPCNSAVAAASIQLTELVRFAARPLGQVFIHGWINALSFRGDASPVMRPPEPPTPPAPPSSSAPPAGSLN